MPITFADVLNDQRVAETLSGDYLELAHDVNALPNHPALFDAGDFFGSGSLTRKVSIVGLNGFDLLQPVGDGASIVPSALSDQQFTLAIARQGKAYAPTDAVRFTDPFGIFNTQAFARDGFMAHLLRLTDIIARLVGGFGRNVTTTGVDLTAATVLAGLIELEVGSKASIAPGQAMGVLHTVQAGDLRTSIATSTGGAIQWNAKPEELLIRGNGYRGQWGGVDWFASDYVPTANAGADRAGGMFIRGGVAIGRMSVYAETALQIAIANQLLFGLDRDEKAGQTDYVSSSWLGGTRGYDTAPHQLGASLVSDA